MISNQTDYMNNLIDRVSYVDIKGAWKPGDNLADVVARSGDTELAKELRKAGLGDYVIKDYANQNKTDGFAAIAF